MEAPPLDPAEMTVGLPGPVVEEEWYVLNPEGQRISGPHPSRGVARTEMKYEPDGVKVKKVSK